MHKIALHEVASDLLAAARRSTASRSTETVLGGHAAAMRQSVIALSGGADLSEHVNPGQASVYVITGDVEIRAEGDDIRLSRGEYVEIPDVPHSLHAVTDAAILLTAVPRGHID
jgi:quercetin dioxygenase-like cupin family protein